MTEAERDLLENWVRRPTTEQRQAQRARMVLNAATGKTTKEIAALLHVRPATVSLWRTRFARDRLEGLADAPRPGKPAIYDAETEQRILAQLDQPPPYATARSSGMALRRWWERRALRWKGTLSSPSSRLGYRYSRGPSV